MNAKTLMFTQFKGGVAKTSSCFEIATILANFKDKKVLLIDLDPQANLTQLSGIEEDKSYDYSIHHSLVGNRVLTPLKISDKLDIIPADIRLALDKGKLYVDSLNDPKFKYKLNNEIEKIKHQYDYIIIDCPPSLDILVEFALFASDYVYIPSQSEVFSSNGLDMNLDALNRIIETNQLKAVIKGVFFTIVDKQRALSTYINNDAKDKYKGLIMRTFIRKNVAICNAQALNQSVTVYERNSFASFDYQALTSIILKQTI